MIKADLHTHTIFSKDSLSHVEDVLAAAMKRGMGAIAITDHDGIEGAIEAQNIARKRRLPLQVIVGEEVRTDDGDLLAYFVKERIAPGKLSDVLAEVKKQKAVCSGLIHKAAELSNRAIMIWTCGMMVMPESIPPIFCGNITR